MHRYLPMTEEDKREMLDAIGVRSVGELFSDIPEKVRFKGDYRIKKAKSETALLKELSELAGKNANLKEYASFLGAGGLRPLYSNGRGPCDLKIRILYGLYTLPAGNLARGTAGHL